MRKLLMLSGFLLALNLHSVEIPDLDGLPDFSRPETVSNRTFVLTTQHSGSHLLLSTIQLLANRCVRHPFTREQFLQSPNPLYFVPVDYDYSKPTLFFTHGCNDVRFLDTHSNKLIVTLRDFKENICRLLVQEKFPEKMFAQVNETHLASLDLGQMLKDEILNLKEIANAYFVRLSFYERWDPNNRLLVGYESMLHNPKETFKTVMNFLGESNPTFDQFFEDEFENHRKYLLAFYRRSGRDCVTQGEDLHFFSKRIPFETLQEIDAFVQARFPNLWEKHLKQYKSEPSHAL